VSYLVRAYDVDAAGNRSPEMKSISFIVDRSSVYAAEDGGERGDGSPDKPFRSLDSAIAAALKAGKRSINLRGAFEMRSPLVSSSEIVMMGGFGRLWAKDPSARANLRLSLPGGQSAFVQRGGSLSLRRIDLLAEASGPLPIVALSDSSLAIEDSSLSAGGEGDLVIVSAIRSKLEISGSRLGASRAMSCTAFTSDSSEISIVGSSIACARGVRIFGAFDLYGGSLSLRESLVESQADLALNAFSVSNASLLVDRSLIKADGGSGFLRLGSFTAVRGEIKNSKILLSWKGAGTLFEIAGGGPAFRHDTIVADSAKGGLRFFDAKGEAPQVWNSILECSGPGSELLRTDSVPGSGLFVANCLWGFESLIAGARSSIDLASLNELNAGSALYSSKPNISEAPEKTFAAPVKSQAPLRADSACVDAALPLEKGYELDFSGHRRGGSGDKGPDIGADELVG
jgi:hypothetical protein